MSKKKYNKYDKYNYNYKKLKNRLIPLAGGSIMAGMMLLGGSTVFADTIDQVPAYSQKTVPSGMHMMRRWNSTVKVEALAKSLGLNSSDIKQELKSGKSLKQIILENGITPYELQSAFNDN